MSFKRLIANAAWSVAGLWAAGAAGIEDQGGVPVQGTVTPAAQAGVAAPASERKLTIGRVFMVANGSMVQVHFTVPTSTTTQWLPVDPKVTYVMDEATGEKFFVANLVRIGPAAQVRLPKGGGSTFMVIDNRHERLKPGARITVVVGPLKQEHVTVAER